MSDLSATLKIPEYDTTDNPDAGLMGDTPAVDVPKDDQQVIADGQPEVEAELGSEEPEPVLIDVNSLKDQFVEMKVDGEIKIVSFEDAMANAQKGTFFTQEMQKLRDQERENLEAIQLKNALQSNPEGTLRLLQEQLGTTTAGSVKEEDTFLTDEERKIVELEQKLARVENRQSVSEQQALLVNDLDALEAQVGSFDRDALLAHATNNGIIGNLRAAYADMNFDKITVGQEALKKQADRQSALEAKRGTDVVSRSQTAATGTQQAHVEKPSTFTDSYLMAVRGEEVPENEQLPSFITAG